MANYSKAFNFRGGFQVDTDVLVVRGEKVGIGSTEPSEVLDVNGIIKARGLDVDATEGIDFREGSVGVLTVREELFVGVSTLDNHGTIIAIGTGIITATSDSVGLVTYYGDGRFLQGLPTSQWIDIDIGLGYTSIYAAGNVGVDTIDPRYAFQVGGVPFVIPAGVGTVPFRFNQEGVGIESGSVYVSDNIRVGGGISVSGTIGIGQTVNVDGNIGVGSNLTVVGFVSAYEFIGIGSQISMINADNIAIGSIGSMRYGDIINTKEVYADRFIGTATMAEDLVPEAQIDIDIARANEVDAITRFISTEGKLQIGTDDPVSVVSDIDLFRTTNVTISGISTAGTSRIFVGKERPAVGSRSFGGIRYGGDPIDSPSGPLDLDLVNFDTGNVNTYLHSGSGGSTTGEFRWIYGQSDRILASLNKEGKLSLFGNTVTGNVNLSVVGISTFEEVRAEEIAVGVGSVAGDFAVYGTLYINGNVGVTTDLYLEGAVFSGDVIVGGYPLDPITPGIGVAISTEGVVTASSGLVVAFGGAQVFGVDSAGNITADGDITIDGDLNCADATVGILSATSGLSGPSLSNFGQVTTVDQLFINGDVSVGFISALNADISNLTVYGSIEFDAGTTSIDENSIEVDILTINNTLNGDFNFTGTPVFSNIEAFNVTVNSTLRADSGIITSLIVESLGVSSITATGSQISVNSNLVVDGELSVSQNLDIQDLTVSQTATFDTLTVGGIGLNPNSGTGNTTAVEVTSNIDGGVFDATFNRVVATDEIDVSANDTIRFSFGTIEFSIDGNQDLNLFVRLNDNTQLDGTVTLS